MSNKVTLFLMTEKGLATIRSLIQNHLRAVVDKVIIGEDKSVQNDYSAAIMSECRSNEISCALRSANNLIKTPYAVAVSWRWLIDIDNTRLIVFHDSPLPKYRGFSPLVNMLIHKENELAVTALFASKNYDEGPIIAQKRLPIDYPLKIGDAITRMADLYSDLAVEIVTSIGNGQELEAIPQNDSAASYSLWRDDEDYKIDWHWEAEKIERFINAVGYPYNGAKCLLNNRCVTILDAQEIDDRTIENRDVGKVLYVTDAKPVVVCEKGLLRIDNAIYTDSKESILPLKKFRSRFA